MNNHAFDKYAGELVKLAHIQQYRGTVQALLDAGFSKTAAYKIADMTMAELLGREAEMGNMRNLQAMENAAGRGPGADSRIHKIRQSVSEGLDGGRARAQAAELANALGHEGKTRLPAYLPGSNPSAMPGTETMLQRELSALERMPKQERMFEQGMKQRANMQPGKTVTDSFHGAIDAADARKMTAKTDLARLQNTVRDMVSKPGPSKAKILAALLGGGALAGGAAAYATREDPTLLERLQGMVG
jgi:hypothetical protein